MITFNAIDVETSNADRSSICQIGITHVKQGLIEDQWKTLVNPQDWFDPWNISIHGIDEDMVVKAPTFPEIRDKLDALLHESVVVCHTSFDRTAIERAMTKYNLEQLSVSWFDSAKIVRRSWPEEYGQKGYGLKNVAKDLNIDFKHHDALEDSRAAAEIVKHAYSETGMNLNFTDWIDLLEANFRKTRKSYRYNKPITRKGNIEGELYGETILFTGSLNIPRRKATDIASELGCNVSSSANKKVSMLVVGTQDKDRLGGYDKSSKHRKVEELIKNGAEILILSEADFFELTNME